MPGYAEANGDRPDPIGTAPAAAAGAPGGGRRTGGRRGDRAARIRQDHPAVAGRRTEPASGRLVRRGPGGAFGSGLRATPGAGDGRGARRGPRRPGDRRGAHGDPSTRGPTDRSCSSWTTSTSWRASPPSDELADLLRWRPRHVRIALGTRRPLGSNTPRLMVSGELVELDSEALRFRSWEVEELFRLVYGEPLSPEGAAALTRRTGGWAAGLMLFHLSTSGKSAVERERAVADLGGRSRLVRSYLTRTVLDELDPERREFLLATCTLGDADRAAVRRAAAPGRAARRCSTTWRRASSSRRSTRTAVPTATTRCCRPCSKDSSSTSSATGPQSTCTRAARCSSRRRAWRGRRCVPTRWRRTSHPWRGCSSSPSAGLAMDPQLGHVDDAGDDPWLALVRARRLQRAGAFAAAVGAFREAEAAAGRLGVPPALRRGTRGGPRVARRRDPPGPAGARLDDAARRGPSRPGSHPPAPGARPAPTAAARRRRRPAPRRRLRCGPPASSRTSYPARSPSSSTPTWPAWWRRSRTAAGGDSVATLEQIILTAEVEEQPWLARLARGVQAAVLLVTSGEPWRVESCESLVEECERSGDAWGEVLLAGALGVAHALRRDAGRVPVARPVCRRARRAQRSGARGLDGERSAPSSPGSTARRTSGARQTAREHWPGRPVWSARTRCSDASLGCRRACDAGPPAVS